MSGQNENPPENSDVLTMKDLAIVGQIAAEMSAKEAAAVIDEKVTPQLSGIQKALQQLLTQGQPAAPVVIVPPPLPPAQPVLSRAEQIQAAMRGETAVPVTTAPAPLAPEQVTATLAAPPSQSLMEKAMASKRSADDFHDRMDQAYKDLGVAFIDAGLAFNHNVIPDEEQNNARPRMAITFLQLKIANGEFTLAQAVEEAKKRGWTDELTPLELILSQLRLRNFNLRKFAKVNGDSLDIYAEVEGAIERGEIQTVDQLIEIAKAGDWLVPFDPERVTINQALREKADAEQEDDRRRAAAAAKRPRNRGKSRR